MESLSDVWKRLNEESAAAYLASPFSALSRDAFARYWRDPSVQPGASDTLIDATWAVRWPDGHALAARMGEHLRDFLTRAMGAAVRGGANRDITDSPRTITLLTSSGGGGGGGEPAPAQSFMIDAEANAIRWFYRTCRTHANFYESCQLRDRLLAPAADDEARDRAPGSPSHRVDQPAAAAPPSDAERQHLLARWREILLDERDNTRAALPIVTADMRLDHYYGGDHTFPHTADMIRAKLALLDHEIDAFLPSLARPAPTRSSAAAR